MNVDAQIIIDEPDKSCQEPDTDIYNQDDDDDHNNETYPENVKVTMHEIGNMESFQSQDDSIETGDLLPELNDGDQILNGDIEITEDEPESWAR